jgi:hypothetical protein
MDRELKTEKDSPACLSRVERFRTKKVIAMEVSAVSESFSMIQLRP